MYVRFEYIYTKQLVLLILDIVHFNVSRYI